MGNKRKLLSQINNVLDTIQCDLGQSDLSIGDGFSGTGIVSRLFKIRASILYTNDIAGYSKTLNECYLATPNEHDLEQIHDYIDRANDLDFEKVAKPWISKHWAPHQEIITTNDRVYFTHENGKRIDIIRDFIACEVPPKFQPYLLAPLIMEMSIHTNTNGQFAAFYKGETECGMYGGKKQVDLKRITQPISLPYPILDATPCHTKISQLDANKWVRSIPELDVVYFDPPYNKHPYNIYYFLLDILNDWDKTQEIPDTYRGQPKNWTKSPYNSLVNAKIAMEDLIKETKAKYIVLSYNNCGIIPISELDELLNRHGKLTKHNLEHKTYNRLKGISNYKRQKEYKSTSEVLYVLKKHQAK